MGQEVDHQEFSRADRTAHREKVRRCLDVFALMLRHAHFEAEDPMTGLEIEFNLVDDDGRPALKNAEALAAIANPDFQTELGQFNLEINVAPRRLGSRGITGFEADHGLPTDGVAGAKVWQALLTAAAKEQRNTHGYSYAIANKGSPETLTIWHNGRKVFSSLANTGIGVAPTVDGTFPVYEKLTYQIMQGTNPDGTKYKDKGVPWVNYFSGGSAVHGFVRSSYGYPQSVGCLELPPDTAKRVFDLVDYGTLVDVDGPYVKPPKVGKPAPPKPKHTKHPGPTPSPRPTGSITASPSATPTKSATAEPTRSHNPRR